MISPRDDVYRPAVWDCFLCNRELELVEFRLHLLRPVVDYFLVVEAPVTFRGEPKKLYLNALEPLLESFGGKIIRVVAEGLEDGGLTPWDRERLQHQAMKRALAQYCIDDEDLVILGDVDEIPDPRIIEAFQTGPPAEPTRIALNHAVYFANWRRPEVWLDGPMVALRRDLDHPNLGVLVGDPCAVWGQTTEPRTPPSGWHFSSLGGTEALVRKYEEYSHVEMDTAREKASAHIDRLLTYGVTPDGRELLIRGRPQEIDQVQADLFRYFPQFFRFDPSPRGSEGFRAYCRLRRRLPHVAHVILDRLWGSLGWAIGACSLVVERLARAGPG